MTPEQEQRALEAAVKSLEGDAALYGARTLTGGSAMLSLPALQRVARLHAARLRVVDAAKAMRAAESVQEYHDAAKEQVHAVDALLALEKEKP